ncbi:MAG: DUF5320 domain-containing protein [Anaerolineales bacterium]|nr:DUF5320 domain-containing protein [Anaerolineales bacterium]
MPRGDRTGPMGAGPRTGRGLGYCGGYDAPGFADPAFGFGRGWGHRRGGGFGWQHRFFATGQTGWGYPRYTPPTQEETLQALKDEAEWLKGQLEAIKKRIEELEK